MSVSLVINESVQAMGFSFPARRTITADGGIVKSVESLAAAKEGQLTTRTSDSAGELTMDAGHGITTGARLDLYWAGGSRRGILVGTVSTNQVPLTTATGAGDVLPANLTDVTAMVPQEEEFLFTGNNAEAIAMFSQRKGIIVLAESDDTEIYAQVLTAGVGHTWEPTRDATVPTAGVSVAKAFFSHGDSENTGDLRVVALYD
jgi:hypothetical protein